MASSLISNLSVFTALVRRDVKVLNKNITTTLIDNIIQSSVFVILFGYLWPLMGLAPQLVGPIYLGQVMMVMFDIGFTLSLSTMLDLNNNRFIDYHLTLPVPKKWLFAAYITSFIIECFLVSAVCFVLGLVILTHIIPLDNLSIIGLSCMYVVSLIFCALLFLTCSFSFSFDWFLDHLWPRLLSPLFCFSSIFLPWQQVNAFSPRIGTLFLLNPFTYIVEGLRAGLLGSSTFLTVPLCATVTLVWSGVMALLLSRGIKRQLDPN